MPTVMYPAIAVYDPATGAPLVELRGEQGRIYLRGTEVEATLVDAQGAPIPQPLYVNDNGFLPVFGVVEGVTLVDFVSGFIRMPIWSPAGLEAAAAISAEAALASQDAAEAAQSAAESAAAGAAAEVEEAFQSLTQSSQSAAAAAEQAASLVEAPSDLVMAGLVGSVDSATRKAIESIDAQPGYDIVLLLGQSNMWGAGAGIDPVAFDPVVGRVHTFPASGVNAQSIVFGSDPLEHWSPGNSVGPGMSFARSYVVGRPSHRKVLLVPVAVSGTAFSTGTQRWAVNTTPAYNNLYEKAIRQAELALGAAGPASRVVGFLWHQGESDAASSGSYAASLDALIAGLRSRLGVPDAWFVVGQMSPPSTALSVGRKAIDAIHIDTPRRVQRTAFAYGPPGAHNQDDPMHYSAAGQRRLGESMALAVPLARANVTGTMPLPPGRVTTKLADRGTLHVTWERPVSRVTDYAVQYRTSGGATWTDLVRAQSLDNSVKIPGLTVGQAYEVRVSALNESGVSAWSPVATVTPSVSIADLGPAPARAFGLRRLVPGYTGALVRVRRSSDNTTQDIGMTSDGLLDELALLTFVGSGDGFVRAWWDQATDGAGTVSQVTTTDAQPRIVTGGVVLKSNGRPVVSFDGIDDHLWSPNVGIGAATGATVIMAGIEASSPSFSPRFWAEGKSTNSTTAYSFGRVTTGSDGLFSVYSPDAGGAITTTEAARQVVPGKFQVLAAVDTRTEVSFFSDLREQSPVARTRPAGAFTPDRFAIGGALGSALANPAKMRLSEIYFWTSALSDVDRRAILANVRQFHDL